MNCWINPFPLCRSEKRFENNWSKTVIQESIYLNCKLFEWKIIKKTIILNYSYLKYLYLKYISGLALRVSMLHRTNNILTWWHRAFLPSVSSHQAAKRKFLNAFKRQQALQVAKEQVDKISGASRPWCQWKT